MDNFAAFRSDLNVPLVGTKHPPALIRYHLHRASMRQLELQFAEKWALSGRVCFDVVKAALRSSTSPRK